MFWKQMPKEKLLEMLKDNSINERTKFRICNFLGISKKATENAGKEVARTKQPKDPYKYSKGQWV